MWKWRLKLLVLLIPLLNHTTFEDPHHLSKLIRVTIWWENLSFLRTKMNKDSKNWKHSPFCNDSEAFMIKRYIDTFDTDTFANFWSASLFMNKHNQLPWPAEESKREANPFWREAYLYSLLEKQDPATLRGYVHGLFMQKTGAFLFLVTDVRPRWESSLKPTQFKLTLPCSHLLLLSWPG